MHELAVTEEIVEIVRRRAGDRRVRRVVIEIGKLSLVLPDAVRFCFDMVAEGTTVEGAALDIVEPDGRGRCRECAAEVLMERPLARCGCGSTDLDWISGEELKVLQLEMI
jgi:hydrogenase nickel incorporation protein HypA/HybF